MIMTINSMVNSALEKITKNEHRLQPIVAEKLKSLVKKASQDEDHYTLQEVNNSMVHFDTVMNMANNLFLGIGAGA